jgi:hypothetical protein
MQMLGVLPRTLLAVLALLPPRFSVDMHPLADAETLRRFTTKPRTVMEALYLGQKDVVLGLMAAAFGLAHDPAAGAHGQGGDEAQTPSFGGSLALRISRPGELRFLVALLISCVGGPPSLHGGMHAPGVRALPGCMQNCAFAGARWPNKALAVVGVIVGLAKAGIGILVRPTAGVVEAGSKGLIGAGLMCLGKRGIQGKLVRR